MNSDLVSDCSVCVCVCVQKASRSRWSRSPVRTACSPTSIIPTVLANTQSPSPGGVSTSRRGELYTACVCVCVWACFKQLPQHITSSDLNGWIRREMRTSSLGFVFSLSPLCRADWDRFVLRFNIGIWGLKHFWGLDEGWRGKTQWWAAGLAQTRHGSQVKIPVITWSDQTNISDVPECATSIIQNRTVRPGILAGRTGSESSQNEEAGCRS